MHRGPVMAFAIENLKVYQKAVDFANHVLGATEQFPRGYGFLDDHSIPGT